ncbi:metallophosphoesterase family protein [Tundrisphaera lichenicola]|uniref:metallophosphoesterase family protein n=1 Tax=Tundrisphaera lichenicola TaxID=2029860 RepID=UPI003EB98AE8
MKLGLISDIHGDSVALELAWAHLTVLGADRIVCAGDLVGYGPHPDRVVAFLAEHGIESVRGNHDRWALERAAGIEGVPSTFGGGMPSAESVETIRANPPDRLIQDGPRIGLITHGSPGDDMDFVTRKTHPPDRLDDYLKRMGVQLMVIGHTHRPMLYRSEHGMVINPGSVISAPVVSTSRTFALLDWEAGEVSFHDVESGGKVKFEEWGGSSG